MAKKATAVNKHVMSIEQVLNEWTLQATNQASCIASNNAIF
jgi:hypothetical protein